MIDTLQLRLADYEVSASALLKVTPPTVNMRTGEEQGSVLYALRSGKEVRGTGAWYPRQVGDPFGFKIMPMRNIPMAFLEFSAPKVVHGTNFTPADRKTTADALRMADEWLSSIGVRCNPLDARLSRVDLTKNVHTSEPYLNYLPVLKLFSPSRMKGAEYDNGMLWKNSRGQVCVYDKIFEQRSLGKITTNLPKNVVRFEARYLRGAKVREAFEMETAKDLLAGFDSLSDVYRNEMRSKLFNFEPPTIDLLCESALERSMQFFKDRYGRNWFDRYMRAVGVDSIEKSIGSPEILRRVVGRLYDGSKKSARQQAWRVSVKLREARYDFGMMQQPELFELRPLSSLYDELRSAVLAA